MSVIAIQAPDIRDAQFREKLVRSLTDVAGELLVAGESVATSALDEHTIEVLVPVEALSQPQIHRFVERIVDLSRSAEQNSRYWLRWTAARGYAIWRSVLETFSATGIWFG